MVLAQNVFENIFWQTESTSVIVHLLFLHKRRDFLVENVNGIAYCITSIINADDFY